MKYILYCRKSTESEDRQVMSLESQEEELERAFGGLDHIEIVDRYSESKSAKAPGRPLFGEMMARIERGEADGIIAWAPDRLARNSIDGGRIVYLLDQCVLKNLRFSTYTFENNPQGKFMLSIMFGQSKYYSDALSENVRRGQRAKLAKGWRPARPAFGYLTDPDTLTIVRDPAVFPLVRRMFEMVLGGESIRQVAQIAADDWGLRMPANRRSRGQAISRATVYRLINNPFYAGVIRWNGQLTPGKHEAVIPWDDYERIQSRLRAVDKPKPKSRDFPFTGLIRCGACGFMVTAEEKVKPSGRRYIYYHCSKRSFRPRCAEPSIRAEVVDAQIAAFLASITLDAAFEAFVLREIDRNAATEFEAIVSQRQTLERRQAEIKRELTELTQLRVRQILSDEEFLRERERLTREQLRLGAAALPTNPFEPAKAAISLGRLAVLALDQDRCHIIPQILKTVCSNSTLKGKILSFQAAKPFRLIARFRASYIVRGLPDHVRTRELNRLVNELLIAVEQWSTDNPEAVRDLKDGMVRLRAEEDAHVRPKAA